MNYEEAQEWLGAIGGSFRVAPAGDGRRMLTITIESEGRTLVKSRLFDVAREGVPPGRRRRHAFAAACDDLRAMVESKEPRPEP